MAVDNEFKVLSFVPRYVSSAVDLSSSVYKRARAFVPAVVEPYVAQAEGKVASLAAPVVARASDAGERALRALDNQARARRPPPAARPPPLENWASCRLTRRVRPLPGGRRGRGRAAAALRSGTRGSKPAHSRAASPGAAPPEAPPPAAVAAAWPTRAARPGGAAGGAPRGGGRTVGFARQFAAAAPAFRAAAVSQRPPASSPPLPSPARAPPAAAPGQVDMVVNTSAKAVGTGRSHLASSVGYAKGVHAEQARHFASARDSYLSQVESTADWGKAKLNPMPYVDAAHAALKAAVAKAREATENPDVAVDEVHKAWLKFASVAPGALASSPLSLAPSPAPSRRPRAAPARARGIKRRQPTAHATRPPPHPKQPTRRQSPRC